jgi:hypothetical protein
MMHMRWLIAAGILGTACTTLGPMPATTGVAAVPSGRPGFELQGGFAPGYYLSAATGDPSHKGQVSGQLLALVEPDHWLGTHGLIAGARTGGNDGDHAAEPFLGYRERLSDAFSLGLVGHATQIHGARRGASYQATRAGGELALDARLVAPAPWLELHVQAAASAAYLDAHGTYCADSSGLGVDCNQDGSDRMIDGTVHGVFAAATGSLALDIGRDAGAFHGARVALIGSTGTMPQVRNGVETTATRFGSVGLTLTLGFGSDR